MAKLRGTIILVTSITILIFETFLLIIDPLLNRDQTLELTTRQYWAVVFPILLLVFLLFGAGAWIGYTMITTPEPIRLDYEEAYDLAAMEHEQSNTD